MGVSGMSVSLRVSCAMVALVAGIAPCVPGFLGTIKVVEVSPFWTRMYDYSWFISFGIAFVLYIALMRLSRK